MLREQMMKRICTVFVFALGIFFLVGVSGVSANEGTTLLVGDKTNGRCFVASVLVDEGDYRVLVTCENLTLPPSSEKLFYHVWAKKASAAASTKGTATLLGRGSYLSFGDLTNGKLAARAREAFTDVLITSEKESNPSGPNLTAIVVSGTIQSIDFGSGRVQIAKPTDAVAQVTLGPVSASGGPSARPTPQTGARSVVGTAFRVFMTILGIIVVAAIAISILQRRSASR